jgi:hypothetical protein
MTQFEQVVQAVQKGELKAPKVSMGNSEIEYFHYQLTNSLFAFKIFAGGMKMRGTKFTDLKKYYGLKARTAKDAVPEFEKFMNDFLNK